MPTVDLKLTDKPVLVCASSSGLGKATALCFARERANVMLASKDEAKLAAAADDIRKQTGRAARFVPTDVTKPDEITRLVDETVKAFGGIYTLVTNSGGPPAGTFDAFDDAAWQSAYDLLLASTVRTVRAALPHLRASSGRILSVTSSGVKAPIENLILSNVFRAGVRSLCKTLATELAKDGVLVNVLSPGRIQTDRLVQLDGIKAQKLGKSVDEVKAAEIKNIPLGRYGAPEEFGAVAAFLGSPANTYVTGQTVLIDGGMVRAL